MDHCEHPFKEEKQSFADLFPEVTSATTRRFRKYFLQYLDGKPVFRSDEIENETQDVRDEIEKAFDEAVSEIFGNDIVPEKLAKLFPGSSLPETSMRRAR